jgi:iron complex transport system substrate-binding protein
MSGLTRRHVLKAGVATALLAAVGCGSDDDDDSAEAGGSGGSGGSGSGGPRTVRHKYGTTEVPADPQRVVTIGLIDHDAALAVGVVPIGVSANDYSADQPHGVWPWAQDELGDAEPVVLPDPEQLNIEAIAELRPDLILAVYSGLADDQYETLSQIAPTVAQSGEYGDYETPWYEMTRTIGQALGREDEAEEAIGRVEDLFAEMREQHPEFEGLTAVYAGYMEAGQYYAEVEGSTRAAILTELGFTIADIPADGFFAEVSSEQVDLLDHDALLWELGDTAAKQEIQSDALYERLDVAREGRDVFVTDPEVAGGLALISVLSLPFVIERLVPMLAAAVDGDPATTVPE